ncbi:MAG: 23S rRNA (pseudouridine(1915)-N(3))-methyltransferase RlmH [Deltaproteobacteria bacterium]|nr:23S rRNA (pseudouridine(1915)-N(3))-methyltransferase RlmH [Deltaproteobacteria bacterium]
MRYRILAVGRRARDPLVDAAEAYLERLTRYVPTELCRFKDATLKEERDVILDRLRDDEHVVLLCEGGEQTTTMDLTRKVQRWRAANKDVALVVGGADGLHPDLFTRGQERLALSRLTLPHRLAVVLLLEQLYRAHTILKGEPYHRA